MAKRRSTTPAFPLRRRRQYVQHGGNFPVFRAMQSQQRGYGLCGMFRSLFRTVTPHLKKGLAYVGHRFLTCECTRRHERQQYIPQGCIEEAGEA